MEHFTDSLIMIGGLVCTLTVAVYSLFGSFVA
jgi:hypothetical protein